MELETSIVSHDGPGRSKAQRFQGGKTGIGDKVGNSGDYEVGVKAFSERVG